MTNFEIVCPKCKAPNTLRYKVIKTTYYTLKARPKAMKPDEGTYEYSQGFKLGENIKVTECVNDGCDYAIEGTEVASRVVKEVGSGPRAS